ncbi:hypothetical protein Celaphus_00004944, partial [Cervus elaphus hippelaphus]
MGSERPTPSRAWTDGRKDAVWSTGQVCCPMAMPKSRLSPVPWEQDGFLWVKMEEEEASLFQVQESSFGHTIHPEAARLRFRHFCFEEVSSPREVLARLRGWLRPEAHSKEEMLELMVLEHLGGRCAGGGSDSGTEQERYGGDCRCSQRTGGGAWAGIEARARQSGGGLVWKSSDSVVRTVAGWALGSELTDTSCKQSGSEESGPWDRAIETVGGGTPPGPAFGDDRESKGGPERQARLSGEMWAQSAAHQMDLRKTSGPHKDAPPAQPSCEAGALGDSPHVRPDLTSREKTPSEERWDPPDGSGTEPPGTCSGRKPP